MKSRDIAILMATYNGIRFIEEQLDSLKSQTYQNFVCYIHDDGSDDGTQEFVNSYCQANPEHFIYMGSSRTGGSKYNFMYLLRNVEADYYMFCDQDDVWLPQKIERTYTAMTETEEADIPQCVYTDLIIVDAHLNIINTSFYEYKSIHTEKKSLDELLYHNVAVGCTMMINRALREDALLEDVVELIHMHDWFLMLLATSIGKTQFLNEPLLYYRQHENNVIGASNKGKQEMLRSFLKFGTWINGKRNLLSKWENNGKALLISLESEKLCASDDKRMDSISITEHYLKRMHDPLCIKIFRYYWRKWHR